MLNIFKKDKDKLQKKLKIVCFILIGIIFLEGLYFLYIKYQKSHSVIYKTTVNRIIEVNKDLVMVGHSDFKHSKLNNYDKDSKAFITKYDKSNKIVFETKYDKGIISKFNDVIKLDDGYLAVGEIQMSEKQITEGSSEGLIVKYDLNGKEVWHKNFVILGVSKFLTVIEDSDKNYVVVGSSLYEANLIGNHDTGGAIIVKYDKDGKKLTHANIDGPKTGVYNDLVEVKDGYIAVGQIKNNSGIIAKYDKNLKLKWRKLFGTTDTYGFRKIVKMDNDFLVIGSKLGATDKDEQSGVILKYNSNGDKLKEEEYKIDKVNRLEDIKVENDKIIVIGMSSKANKDENVDSFVLTLNKDLEKTNEQIKKENKSILFSGLVKINNKIYVYGYSNSKIKDIKSNGKDIIPVILNLEDLKYFNLFN